MLGRHLLGTHCFDGQIFIGGHIVIVGRYLLGGHSITVGRYLFQDTLL